jgi:GNAT superfamily N-acetyltransferase
VWTTHELDDKSQILACLEDDRLFTAYAIGDLEPGLFEQSTWVGAQEDGRLRALALHFRGLKLPALFLTGDQEGLQAILEKGLRPERAYLTCRVEHLSMVRGFYAWEEPVAMWRMVLQPARFRRLGGDCVRLGPAHAGLLGELYALGETNAFTPAQVAQGVFYGAFSGSHLVAAAGTHLVSPTYGVAAVGNVFTHPDHRGRGYGTAVTSAVVNELLRRGIHDVVLNVSQANAPAVRIYERLGFQRYCPFLEGPASANRDRPAPGFA